MGGNNLEHNLIRDLIGRELALFAGPRGLGIAVTEQEYDFDGNAHGPDVSFFGTAKLPLALEPLHPMYCADRAAVNTLAQALDIAQRLDPQQTGALGVAVDVYHTWWDPNLYDGIARAGREKRILAYHVSDWLVPTKDMLNDRGMMGDGVIELSRIRAASKQRVTAA